jgi:hypothetical protein
MSETPADLALLRHTVATLAYRAAKTVRGAPPEFAGFRASATSRTPVQILAHMGDLFDWALTMADGKAVWHDATPLPWDEEVARFFAALERFDARLATGRPLANPATKVFAGPIADALTHTGQINFLRRLAGTPVKGESYFRADIEAGRVGQDQAPAKVEFD